MNTICYDESERRSVSSSISQDQQEIPNHVSLEWKHPYRDPLTILWNIVSIVTQVYLCVFKNNGCARWILDISECCSVCDRYSWLINRRVGIKLHGDRGAVSNVSTKYLLLLGKYWLAYTKREESILKIIIEEVLK